MAEGIAAGEFRQVDPQETAVIIIAQLEGLILLWAIDPQRVDLLKLTETAVDLLLDGLQSNN